MRFINGYLPTKNHDEDRWYMFGLLGKDATWFFGYSKWVEGRRWVFVKTPPTTGAHGAEAECVMKIYRPTRN